MPLVSCPDCGHQISSLASACPACARPINAARTGVMQPVRLIQADLTFGNLFTLILKATIASIPAMIVFAIMAMMFTGAIVSIVGGIAGVKPPGQ